MTNIKKAAGFLKKKVFVKNSPRQLAFGVSLGLLTGLLPIAGFKTAVVILLGLVFRLNILAIAAGSGITLVFPLLTLLAFDIGEKLTSYRFTTYSPYYLEFDRLISGILPTRVYLLGSLVTGITLGALIYLPSLWFFNYRKINLHRPGEQAFVFFESRGRRNALAKRVAVITLLITIGIFGLVGLSITINPILPIFGVSPFRKIPSYDQIASTMGKHNIGYQLTKMNNANRASLFQTDYNHRNFGKHHQRRKVTNKSDVIFGFYVNWDPNSYLSLQRNINHLNYLSPEWIHLTGNGPDLTEEIDNKVTTLATNHHVPVIPLFNNYSDGWRTGYLRQVLREPAKRTALVDKLFKSIKSNGFHGINIDLENLSDSDSPYLVLFMRELYGKFHSAGLLVTQDMAIDDPSYDYKRLAEYNDYIILMAYDEHYESSQPGPIASRDWFARTLAGVPIPPQKLIVGLGNYGVDWAENGTGEEVTFEKTMALADEFRVPILWDKSGGGPNLKYTDEDNVPHTVWFQDAVSAYNQVLTSMNYGQAGFGLWRLGAEDPSVWRIFSGLPKLPTPSELSVLSPFDSLQRLGSGEILQVVDTPKSGRRQISVGPGQQITEEKYLSFPAYYVLDQLGYSDKKQVALTFDDGPDPKYTREILDILKKYNVKATFFVVGSNAQKNPGLVARAFQQGNLLGNHTFTHPNMALISPEQTRLELNATQRVIEEITGHKTILFRPPYVADAEPQTPEELIPIIRAQELGYLTVGELIDALDWSRPGTDQIVNRVLSQVNRGNIVLLHDAGGDRSQTVEALPRIIEALNSKGYTFVTVDQLLRTNRAALMPAVSGLEDALVSTDRLGFTMLFWQQKLLWWMFTLAIILGVGRLGFLATASLIQYWRSQKRKTAPIEGTPLASVIIAAYDEEKVIGNTIESLLKSTYPNIEIIVVDDGSKDRTSEVVTGLAKRDGRVRLLNKTNGGKATAVNLGIEQAAGEYIVTLDADTVFEPGTIGLLLRHFTDPSIGAVSGNVKVGNVTNLLTVWQFTEYIIGFNLERRAFEVLNCITVVPGAVGAWRKEAIIKAGGYSSDTLAEDTDLTLNIREMGYKISYESKALAWTESPADIKSLLKQRFRWTFGTLQCLWKHRETLMNPRYGTLGLIAMPNMWVFQVGFQVLSPLVDIMMVVAAFTGHFELYLAYYLAFYLLDLLVGLLSFALEGEKKKPLIWLFIQRIVYRQILYYVMIKSIWTAIKGINVGWNKLQRHGTVEAVKPLPAKRL